MMAVAVFALLSFALVHGIRNFRVSAAWASGALSAQIATAADMAPEIFIIPPLYCLFIYRIPAYRIDVNAYKKQTADYGLKRSRGI
jgi:hypothetical protein